MSSIAKKSAETFVARVISQAAVLAVGIAMARFLGPYGKGVYAYAATVLGLMITLASGQSSAIAWQLSKGKQPPALVYAAMLRTIVVFAIPISAALIIVAATFPAQRVLLTTAIALPFALYMALASGFFLAASDVRGVNIQTIITSLFFLLAIPVVFFHGSITAVLAIWVASYVAAAVYSTFRMRKRIASSTTPETSHYPFKQQLFFGLKTTLNSVVEELNMRINLFLIVGMLGTRMLGIYSVAIGMAGVLWQLSRPVATAAFGRIGSEPEASAAELTARCTRHSLAFVGAAAVVAFIVGPWLITLVYGAKFAAAGLVLRVLMPGIVAYCIMPMLATFFTQQLGRPSIPLVLSAISTALCAAVTAVLLPHYGLVAAAAATSVSYVVAVAIGAILFMRRTGLSPAQVFILNSNDMRQYAHLLGSITARIRARTFARATRT
jgi:O-antigen/teichoic acid export membrane protein